MICPSCGKENSKENLFCANCGNKLKGDTQTETNIVTFNSEIVNSENQMDTETKKVFNKKYIWGIIIGIFVISVGVFSFKQYSEYKNFNLNVAEAEKNYKVDKFSEAKQYYQTALKYKKDSNIESKIKLCDNMEGSYKEYNNGIEALNKKDYLTSYNCFKKVISDDTKRFSLAKDKITETSKLYIDSELVQAKDLASKVDYQAAITHTDAILNIDSNNETAKKLKTQYESDLQKKLDEQKRIEEEQAKRKEIDNVKNTIRLINAWTSRPNSANGVDLNILWTNTSNKVIKYTVFNVVPYNAVGDPQQCDIRHDTSFRGKVTGPINPGQTYGGDQVWECAWYNNTIVSVKVKSIDITYMDGSTVSLDDKQSQYALDY